MFLLATYLYALVGGPFVGKTSIIEALQEAGELIGREAALDFIIEEQARGIKAPWEEPGFEIRLFDEKVRRENHLLEVAKKADKARVFLDRGLHDSLAYIKMNKKEASVEADYIVHRIKELAASNRYKAVFYVEPYSSTHFRAHTSEERHETTEMALQIASLIKEAYETAQVHLIPVPPDMTPKERALFVLKEALRLEESAFEQPPLSEKS